MTPAPTWVLLRGWTREAGHWGDFPERLRAALPNVQVLTPDLPGCGLRRDEHSPSRVDAIVAACRARLGAAPPLHLVGLSLGGMVAAQWAASHPDEVAACVLVNTSMRGAPAARLRPSAWPALLRIACARDPRAVEAGILALTSNAAPDPGREQGLVSAWVALREARPVSRGTAWRQLLAAARFALPPPPDGPRRLVLCSAADRLVDVRCSRALAARWNAALQVHPHAGHDLPLDDPDWVIARLRSVHSAP
ncbi:MAG: alpha/beta fold hydrolase [Piscinibacter sp.]|nr:alpha/beta fold hydrolase [Piscinibacter sp.]